MYYAVKLGKKTYYSKEIVKHVRRLGDAGILREVSKGNLHQVQILSVNLFELGKSEVENLDLEKMGVITQELNAIVKTFTGIDKVENAEEVTDASGVITWSQSELGDYQFVELRNVLYAKKYQIQGVLPILDVCGTRYVALNTVKKGCDKYIS